MIRSVPLRSGLFGALLVLGGCKTAPELQAAQFADLDDAARAEITSVLADAVGRAKIEIGPAGLIGTSVITVLPPPLGPNETRSPAMPEPFGVVSLGNSCLLIRQRDGEAFALTLATCQPVAP